MSYFSLQQHWALLFSIRSRLPEHEEPWCLDVAAAGTSYVCPVASGEVRPPTRCCISLRIVLMAVASTGLARHNCVCSLPSPDFIAQTYSALDLASKDRPGSASGILKVPLMSLYVDDKPRRGRLKRCNSYCKELSTKGGMAARSIEKWNGAT